MDLFEIPPALHEVVRRSWEARQPDLIGRFDLLYDGKEPAKLLEYNADTPTLLLESALAQAQWRTDRQAQGIVLEDGAVDRMEAYSQFNTLDQALVDAWPTFIARSAKAAGVDDGGLHILVASQRASLEERCNADYLAETCKRAGVSAASVELSDLHVDESGRVWHLDPDFETRREVNALWKLYPYEWLAREELGHALEQAYSPTGQKLIWAEPPWKLVLANKSVLALLWEMFPGHPNLLPAFFTTKDAQMYQDTHQPVGEEWGWVSKPKFGREGIGVRYSFDSFSFSEFDQMVRDDLNRLESTSHPYNPSLLWELERSGREVFGSNGSTSMNLMEERQAQGAAANPTLRAELPFPPLGAPVFQLFQDTQTFCGRRPVLGSWIVFGSPAGICVREDIQRTTDNDSCFTPHLVDLSASAPLLVTHRQVGKSITDVSGSYALTGQLRGAGIYHCKEKRLYLMRDAKGFWMFTFHESGGDDGLMGTAVARTKVAKPEAVPASAWRHFDSADGDFKQATVPNLSIAAFRSSAAADFIMSEDQAVLRRELYGKSGGKQASDPSHGRHTNHSYGTGYGRSWSQPSSTHHSQSSQHSHQWQQQQQHSQQEQQQQHERHGRKSASRTWQKYGQRQPTGTYGRSMGNVGSGGGGGS